MIKIWEGNEVVEPFVYAEFAEELGDFSGSRSRDIAMGERLINPIQVPLYVGPGVETSIPPMMTTRWCLNNPGYPGCELDSDIIYGVIGVQSQETISVTQMIRIFGDTYGPDPSSGNLLDSPIVSPVTADGSVRYAEVPYSECRYWIDNVGNGLCVARQATLDGLGMPDAERAFYEWDLESLTPIIFQTSGGRDIRCQRADGQCVYIRNAKPGVFLIEGEVVYEVIFHDPVYERLGAPTFRLERDYAMSFYMQVVAPFTEAEESRRP